MRRNSHTHVVYGYTNAAAAGDPAVMGFGKSDRQAIADARTKATMPLFYFFVRSNGEKVQIESGPLQPLMLTQ